MSRPAQPLAFPANGLTPVPLPDPVAAKLLEMVSGRLTGNVVLHFKAGELRGCHKLEMVELPK